MGWRRVSDGENELIGKNKELVTRLKVHVFYCNSDTVDQMKNLQK